MKKRFLRTLVILACGIAMALVAYAGQMGYKEEDLLDETKESRGESIRLFVQDGLLLDYQLLLPQAASSSQSPELVLYISCEGKDCIDDASVIYRIIGPRGTELQARALTVRGRYDADIYFASRGRYQVATEIQTSLGTINDRFDYEML